jgi:hypothetical protein
MGYIEYTTGIQPDTFTADDVYSKVQGTRDGAPFSADWVLARCLEGRVFVANAGTITSPITFGAGSMSETEHDLAIYVPSGTTIGILAVNIQMEAFGTSAIFECMAKVGTYTTANTGGTAITPRNLRTDSPFSSNCTIYSACTTTASTTLTGPEFFRDGRQVAKSLTTAAGVHVAQPFKYSWVHKAAGYIPIVVGAGACAVYAAAQAGTGFISVMYVEIPSNRIT